MCTRTCKYPSSADADCCEYLCISAAVRRAWDACWLAVLERSTCSLVFVLGMRRRAHWRGCGCRAKVADEMPLPTCYCSPVHDRPPQFGHNLGLNHGRTTKFRDIQYPPNDAGQDGNNPGVSQDSQMASGLRGDYFNSESARYISNGHFDVSAKHWFGWIEDEQVVFMHHDGGNAIGCAQCVSAWAGKINAFDRPDVIPGQTSGSSGSDVFAVKIHYSLPFWHDLENSWAGETPAAASKDHVIYIHFRTSIEKRRLGVSLQYCFRAFSGSTAGFASTCYAYDAHGDTYTMDDSVILPGETFVAMPPYQAIQGVGYRRAMRVLPRIRVDAVSSFDDCPDMICPTGKDISATVSIDFVSPADAAAAVSPDVRITPSTPVTAAQDKDGKLDVYFDDFKNDKGVADITVTACPINGLESIDIYLYDLPPLSSLLPGA